MKRVEAQTQEKLKGLLLKELADRKASNPRISLRSFARILKMSPAHLSNILSGRRPVTSSNLQKIFQALDVSGDEKKRLLQSTASASALPKKILSDEELADVSQWHYFAILTLAQVPQAKADSRWIARRLGISEVDALEALRRLEMNGLIEIKEGNFFQVGNSIDTKNDLPSKNVRRVLKQGLQRAVDSLDTWPVERREFGAQYIAIGRDRIEDYKKLLRSFKNAVDALAEGEEQKSDVYCFSYQLFPVTHDSKESIK